MLLRFSFAISIILQVLISSATECAARPNLLLIVADDMGWGDLGCMGSTTIETPVLDRLASGGVLGKQAYVASSVCSPSRAGLMTGRDPRRFGYEGNLNESATNYTSRPELLGLPTEEHTLADHLRSAGYSTALIGKWHLGTEEQFHPNQRGFDYFCGMLGGGHNYFPRRRSRIERNGTPVSNFSSHYLTDFFSDEAIRWLEDHRNTSTDEPWMMMLSYNAPHTPMQAREDDLEHYKNIDVPDDRRIYVAMVHALDRAIGRVVKHLESTNQRDNTMIVFISDNGGAVNNSSWNGLLSGSKGTLREGGVRIPMIWNWPGKIQVGLSTDQVMSSLDILPTFLAAADAKTLPLNEPPQYQDLTNFKRSNRLFGSYDGVNLLPFLTGETDSIESRDLFWRLQGQAAVLSGEHKLINLTHRPAQLFAPGIDPGEQQDLAISDREELERLFELLGDWQAKLPTVPIWDSSPKWWGDSARKYDSQLPRPEPK